LRRLSGRAILLNFERSGPAEAGIAVPVVLSVGISQTEVKAKLDTGATCCVFEREIREDLGLDIESGAPERIWTATGAFLAYGHEVSITAFGYQFNVIVYFTSPLDGCSIHSRRLGWRGNRDRM
jgi:hypothetical protein